MRPEDSDIGRPRDVVAVRGFLGTMHLMPVANAGMNLRATAGHPARGRFFGVAAGLLARRSPSHPGLPNARRRISDAKIGSNSLLTVAGAAPEFRGYARYTGFPLSHQILRSGGP